MKSLGNLRSLQFGAYRHLISKRNHWRFWNCKNGGKNIFRHRNCIAGISMRNHWGIWKNAAPAACKLHGSRELEKKIFKWEENMDKISKVIHQCIFCLGDHSSMECPSRPGSVGAVLNHKKEKEMSFWDYDIMMEKDELSFHQACSAILIHKKEPSLNWAVNYAKYGLEIPDEDGEQQRVQALYILGNITRWRGELAKRVRATLKKVGGVK